MSSTIAYPSSSLLRPYIGSCRNRNYISNRTSSLLSHDYYFSTNRSSKSLLPRPFRAKNAFSHELIINAFEERVPIKYGSTPIALYERQLNQEQKAKGFLPSSSSPSSSSLFLFPTITPRTHYEHSLIREQQRSRQPYPSEQEKHFHTHLPDPLSSLNLFNDPLPMNQFTSTPIPPSIFPTNHHSNLTMSSLQHHSYDQRVSDQGNKYIIQLKTDDYQANDFLLTPRPLQNQLIIDAKHHEEDSSGGFIHRELHKIFLIPKHIDLNKYTYSYNQNTQELTVEMPYIIESLPAQNTSQTLTFSYGNLDLTNGRTLLPPIHTAESNNTNGISTKINESTDDTSMKPFDFDLFHRSAFRPQILPTTTTNENKLLMSLDLSDYQPEDIKISIKDQELIVKAERKIQTDTRKSSTSFFQSTTLPPRTDVEHLQSNYIDGKLIIEAPYLTQRKKTHEGFRIESEENQPSQQRTETVIEFVRRRRF